MRNGLGVAAGIAFAIALTAPVPALAQDMPAPTVERLTELMHEDAADMAAMQFKAVHVVKLEEGLEEAAIGDLNVAVTENDPSIQSVQDALMASALKDRILEALKTAYGADLGADASDESFFNMIVAAEVKGTPEPAAELILYTHPVKDPE